MRTDFVVLLFIVGVAVGSMPVYAMTARGTHDPHDMADRGDFILGSFVRSWFYWFIRPVEWLLLTLRLSPTALNVIGAGLGAAAGVCFATGRVTLAGWAVLLGGAADVLDGRIARARDMADERGAFLDSTLDRFAEVGAFVGLAVLYRASAAHVALVAAALGGSLVVSYARARGQGVGVDCKVGIMQRAERLLLVGFGGILDPSVTAWQGWAPGTLLIWIVGIMAVGTIGTAIYRTIWIANRLDERSVGT